MIDNIFSRCSLSYCQVKRPATSCKFALFLQPASCVHIDFKNLPEIYDIILKDVVKEDEVKNTIAGSQETK